MAPVLAHAGEGATWQALVTLLAIGVGVVFLLVVIGRLKVHEPDDLVLPLAATAIVASLAPATSSVLSDFIGWGIPAGVVLLAAIVVHAVSPLSARGATPLSVSAAVLAVALGLVLNGPLSRSLHPPPELLPARDDATVTIVTPQDGATVEAGTIPVTVEVSGGTVGPGGLTSEQLPTDPEELGNLLVYLDLTLVDLEPREPCRVASPCAKVTYDLEVGPGEHDLIVEFRRGDDIPLAPTVSDRARFTAE